MAYINKIIYFVGRVWFAFVMFLALVLTSVLSIPFLIMEMIDGSPSKREIIILKEKGIRFDRTTS